MTTVPARLRDPNRLAALERSGLLSRALDERLERLVTTAASVLNADASQLNVLTDTSQHRLSRWPPVTCTQVSPVSESGCRHVVEAGTTLVVPDTAEHPVLCVMPWARTWRSYLGTPIDYDSEPIGALCVLTRQPREWSRTDVMALEAVGRLVSHALF